MRKQGCFAYSRRALLVASGALGLYAGVRSRHSPGSRVPSSSPPKLTRLRRVTSCPAAAKNFRISRFLPSCSSTVRWDSRPDAFSIYQGLRHPTAPPPVPLPDAITAGSEFGQVVAQARLLDEIDRVHGGGFGTGS